MISPGEASGSEPPDEQAFAKLVDKVARRVQRGEAVDVKAICRHHPSFRGRLNRLVAVMHAMRQLAEVVADDTRATDKDPPTGDGREPT